MKKAVAAAIVAAISSTTFAAPVWDKVDFGMTRAEVEAIYPRGPKVEYQKDAIEISDIKIMGECDAEVNIRFGADRVVKEVMIAGNPSMGGRCSRDVMAGLAAKYGEPLNKDATAGTILARQGKVLTWARPDGVTMQFKKFENGFMGGGGLGKSSWELTYSKLAASLSL